MSDWGGYQHKWVWNPVVTYTGGNMTVLTQPLQPISAELHPEPEPQQEEDDMAKRYDFTFSFSGAEIADACVKQIDLLRERIAVSVRLEEAAEGLRALGASVDESEALEDVDELESEIANWEVEERTYRREPEARFDLDSEDIDHYGL